MNWELLAQGMSGEWVLELVTKIFVGVAALITAAWAAYKKGQAAPTTMTKIKPNPLKVREEKPLATKDELKETEARLVVRISRVEDSVDEIRDDQTKQFRMLLESGAEREMRVMAKIDQAARETHARIDRLMEKGGLK